MISRGVTGELYWKIVCNTDWTPEVVPEVLIFLSFLLGTFFCLAKRKYRKEKRGRRWKRRLRIYVRGAENPRSTQNLLQRVLIRPAPVMRDGAFPMRPTLFHYEERALLMTACTSNYPSPRGRGYLIPKDPAPVDIYNPSPAQSSPSAVPPKSIPCSLASAVSADPRKRQLRAFALSLTSLQSRMFPDREEHWHWRCGQQ